jgi:hypothetical protein
MGLVNSQRENGPQERENGLRPGSGGQQLKTEEPFISRELSQQSAAGETVSTIDSWRREAHSPQTFFSLGCAEQPRRCSPPLWKHGRAGPVTAYSRSATRQTRSCCRREHVSSPCSARLPREGAAAPARRAARFDHQHAAPERRSSPPRGFGDLRRQAPGEGNQQAAAGPTGGIARNLRPSSAPVRPCRSRQVRWPSRSAHDASTSDIFKSTLACAQGRPSRARLAEHEAVSAQCQALCRQGLLPA